MKTPLLYKKPSEFADPSDLPGIINPKSLGIDTTGKTEGGGDDAAVYEAATWTGATIVPCCLPGAVNPAGLCKEPLENTERGERPAGIEKALRWARWVIKVGAHDQP